VPDPAVPAPSPRLFTRANLPAIAAAIFSGVVLRLVSPPIGLHWLHWFSFVPLLVAAAAPDGRPVSTHPLGQFLAALRGRAFKLGYLTGFSGVFVLFFWLAQTIDLFSNIPLVLAALLVALFAAVFGLPYGFLASAVAPLRARIGGWWVVAFPTVWVAAEFAQPALFPYYQGVGQYRNPYTWQLASVFGAYGVSWLLLCTNAALAEVVLARKEGRPFPVAPFAAALGLFVANLGFGYWRFNMVEAELAKAPVVRISELQQGVSMVKRIEDRGTDVLRSWMKSTAKVTDDKPDLVVWPEGSIGYNPTEKELQPILGGMAKRGDFAFLLGGGTHGPDPADPSKHAAWNSVYLFGRDGEVKARYDKMVPMPFGEYLPWPASYLKPYIQGVGSFRAGTEPTVFYTDKFSFTVPICYEAILEKQMRTLAIADAYVSVTNDGWFGDTAAPWQHAMLAAAYAVELGRPMIRIAYTGVSMVVEPHGVIKYETQPYTDVAKVVELRVPKGGLSTPYQTWGRWFPHLCAVFTVLLASLIAAGRVTPRRSRA